MDDAWLTHGTFAPLVGTSFTTMTEHGAVELTLESANDSGIGGGTSPDGHTRTQFSLEFAGPADTPLEQGTYELTSAALGTQPIFLVPVQGNPGSRYYEAIFA